MRQPTERTNAAFHLMLDENAELHEMIDVLRARVAILERNNEMMWRIAALPPAEPEKLARAMQGHKP